MSRGGFCFTAPLQLRRLTVLGMLSSGWYNVKSDVYLDADGI